VKIPLHGLRVLVVKFNVVADFRLKGRNGIEIATPQNAAVHAAEQNFNPVQPRTILRHVHEPKAMRFIFLKTLLRCLWISTRRS
jgi:hypothetical protein